MMVIIRSFFYLLLIRKLYHYFMTNCKFCGKLTDAGTNDGIDHEVCNKIWQKRDADKICSYCGEKPVGRVSFCCTDCDHNSQFKGFDGP